MHGVPVIFPIFSLLRDFFVACGDGNYVILTPVRQTIHPSVNQHTGWRVVQKLAPTEIYIRHAHFCMPYNFIKY